MSSFATCTFQSYLSHVHLVYLTKKSLQNKTFLTTISVLGKEYQWIDVEKPRPNNLTWKILLSVGNGLYVVLYNTYIFKSLIRYTFLFESRILSISKRDFSKVSPLREHSQMTSDNFWVFRYFTTLVYLSDIA